MRKKTKKPKLFEYDKSYNSNRYRVTSSGITFEELLENLVLLDTASGLKLKFDQVAGSFVFKVENELKRAFYKDREHPILIGT